MGSASVPSPSVLLCGLQSSYTLLPWGKKSPLNSEWRSIRRAYWPHRNSPVLTSSVRCVETKQHKCHWWSNINGTLGSHVEHTCPRQGTCRLRKTFVLNIQSSCQISSCNKGSFIKEIQGQTLRVIEYSSVPLIITSKLQKRFRN